MTSLEREGAETPTQVVALLLRAMATFASRAVRLPVARLAGNVPVIPLIESPFPPKPP